MLWMKSNENEGKNMKVKEADTGSKIELYSIDYLINSFDKFCDYVADLLIDNCLKKLFVTDSYLNYWDKARKDQPGD